MDLRALIVEQVERGLKAGELVNNPAFIQTVADLHAEFYEEFRKADVGKPTDLLMAHLKDMALREIVQRLDQAFEVGRSNQQNAKREN